MVAASDNIQFRPFTNTVNFRSNTSGMNLAGQSPSTRLRNKMATITTTKTEEAPSSMRQLLLREDWSEITAETLKKWLQKLKPLADWELGYLKSSFALFHKLVDGSIVQVDLRTNKVVPEFYEGQFQDWMYLARVARHDVSNRSLTLLNTGLYQELPKQERELIPPLKGDEIRYEHIGGRTAYAPYTHPYGDVIVEGIPIQISRVPNEQAYREDLRVSRGRHH